MGHADAGNDVMHRDRTREPHIVSSRRTPLLPRRRLHVRRASTSKHLLLPLHMLIGRNAGQLDAS